MLLWAGDPRCPPCRLSRESRKGFIFVPRPRDRKTCRGVESDTRSSRQARANRRMSPRKVDSASGGNREAAGRRRAVRQAPGQPGQPDRPSGQLGRAIEPFLDAQGPDDPPVVAEPEPETVESAHVGRARAALQRATQTLSDERPCHPLPDDRTPLGRPVGSGQAEIFQDQAPDPGRPPPCRTGSAGNWSLPRRPGARKRASTANRGGRASTPAARRMRPASSSQGIKKTTTSRNIKPAQTRSPGVRALSTEIERRQERENSEIRQPRRHRAARSPAAR